MYRHTSEILYELESNYGELETELNYESPYQLLIATILSAQTTDKQVNKVTEKLFKRYPTVFDIVKLSQEELEKHIKTCGFYRNKSKNILKTSKALIESYNGEVPKSREALIELSGVGRKTANVVISNVFDIPAIAVDTHVFRVSNRLGLVRAKNVEETEQQLMIAIPREKWSSSHHWLIRLGRDICKARRPQCDSCFLNKYCYYNTKQHGEDR